MDFVVAAFALIAAWVVLRVLGGERERRVHDLAVTIAAQPPDPAAPAAPPAAPAPPVRSQAAR